MTEQEALSEVVKKFGTGKIPLHRTDYTEQLSSEVVSIIKNLRWAFDDTGEIKYSVRKCDQIVNLEVWK